MSEESEWIKLGYHPEKKEIFYQKKEIYQLYDSNFADDVSSFFDLKNAMVCSCKNGGAIAVTRDPNKVHFESSRKKTEIDEQIIAIYKCSGERISSFEWPQERYGILQSFGFTERETLVCISETGKVVIYDIRGKSIKQFNFIDDLMDEEILKVKVSENAIIVLTKAKKVWIISTIHSDKASFNQLPGKVRIENIEEIMEENIKMKVVERKEKTTKSNTNNDDDDTNDGNNATNNITGGNIGAIQIDVYVIVKNDSTITHISTDQPFDSKKYEDLKFKDLAVSPNGKLLALFTSKNTIWITNSTFIQTTKTQVKNPELIPNDHDPNSIHWCGNECIVLYYQPNSSGLNDDPSSRLVLIGPTMEFYEIKSFSGAFFIDEESDGLKLVSKESYDFLFSIGLENQSIFKIGSLDSSAILFDAYEEFINQKASSIKKIRTISKDIKKAVSYCIIAAGNEFSTENQSKLLKAASYGKSFIQNKTEDEQDGGDEDIDVAGEKFLYANKSIDNFFVSSCKLLRIFNTLRNKTIGIPITKAQFDNNFTIKKIVSRLCNRNEHLLSFKICSYLGLYGLKKNVLIHWAKRKVETAIKKSSDGGSGKGGEGEYEVINEIKEKCKGQYISYAKLAVTAYQNKKIDLAKELLELEKYPGEKIELLLLMNTENDLKEALYQALLSGEMDKVHLVLMTMKNSKLFKPKKLNLPNPFIQTLLEPRFSDARTYYLSYLKKNGSVESTRFLKTFYSDFNLKNQVGNICLLESFKKLDFKEKIDKLNSAKKSYSEMKNTYSVEAKYCDYQKKLLALHNEYNKYLQEDVFIGQSIIQTIQTLIKIEYQENELRIVKKLRKSFDISEKHFYWVVLNTLSRLGRWEKLREFAQSGKSPIGYSPFYQLAKKYHQKGEAEWYLEHFKIEK